MGGVFAHFCRFVLFVYVSFGSVPELRKQITPYGTHEAADVLASCRQETGEVQSKNRPKADWASTTAKWMVDPDKPAYASEFGGFIRKLVVRYDGNLDLEGVDLSTVGERGESADSNSLTETRGGSW